MACTSAQTGILVYYTSRPRLSREYLKHIAFLEYEWAEKIEAFDRAFTENVTALALIYGSVMLILERFRDRGAKNSYPDWHLPGLALALGVSGMGVQLIRLFASTELALLGNAQGNTIFLLIQKYP